MLISDGIMFIKKSMKEAWGVCEPSHKLVYFFLLLICVFKCSHSGKGHGKLVQNKKTHAFFFLTA